MMLRATFSAALLAVSATAGAQFYGNIDPISAFDWLNAYDDVVLLDVRTAEEWRWVGHPGPNGLADSKGTGLAYNSGAGLSTSGDSANVVNISFRVAAVKEEVATNTTAIYYPIAEGDRRTSLPLNPDFVFDVINRFGDPDAVTTPTLLLMCRSGVRGEDAAELLGGLGYETWNIEGGFEGHTNTDEYPGPDTGYPDVDGWKNAKLPWNRTAAEGYNKVLIVPEE